MSGQTGREHDDVPDAPQPSIEGRTIARPDIRSERGVFVG